MNLITNSKNKTKTLSFIIATVLLIAIVTLCVFLIVPKVFNPKARVFRFVENKITELHGIVEMRVKDEDQRPSEFNGCKIQYIDIGDVPIIQFEMGGYGIVPSSAYYGFYYSPDDLPHVYWNGDAELLSESDNSWSYELGGDNHGSTERIMPHWYYYEVSF